VDRIEKHLGHPIRHTSRSYKKFNVFVMDLRKGSM